MFVPRFTDESAFIERVLLIRENINVADLTLEDHQLRVSSLRIEEEFMINIIRPWATISGCLSIRNPIPEFSTLLSKNKYSKSVAGWLA